MKKVIDWFRKLFGYLGDVWETFRSSNAGSKIIATLNDIELQREAFSLVKTLADSSLTAKEKEVSFNQTFTTWCNNNGYAVQASIVNTLRELAYAAYNIKREQAGA